MISKQQPQNQTTQAPQLIPRLISAAIFLSAFLLLVSVYIGKNGIKELQALKAESGIMSEKEGQLTKELDELKREMWKIKNSDYSLEKAAREELGYSTDKEIVYVFPRDK